MVVDVFRLEFPAEFAVRTVEVDGHRHVSAVVVLFEQGCLMFLHMTLENSRTSHLNKTRTLGFGVYLAGAREEVFPPRPIFFDILKVDNCYSIYLNYYKI